jgi:hypothetical protein
MPSRRSLQALVLVAAVLAGSACSTEPPVTPGTAIGAGPPPASPAGPSGSSPGSAGPAVPSTASPAIPPEPAGTPPAAPGDEPPQAGLVRVDGEPVIGQLGTFLWRDGGSDSPWLPGTPATIDAAVRLEFGLSAAVPVASWRARLGRAGVDDPSSARPIGEGTGAIGVAGPPPGRWTLELTVVFGEGLGDARYYWLLDVR